MTRRRDVPRGVIGMIHLPPLPGAPDWGGSMGAVLDRAVADARALVRGGVDALLVENYGDTPFHAAAVPPATVAAMTRAVSAVRDAARDAAGGEDGRPEPRVGVNVLRNDAAAALSVAAATGAAFVRVNVHTGGMYTDQGWVEGQAAATVRLRERIAPDTAILADVLVKHATPPAGLALADAARDAWWRGHADALIVSGPATGAVTDLERVRAVRRAVPEAVLLVGSGVTPSTVHETLEAADAVIVGSALEADGRAGNPVDPARVNALFSALGRRAPR